MKQTLFITGTDTGAGKTVLMALLARSLRERGGNAAALKPICSGGKGSYLIVSTRVAKPKNEPWKKMTFLHTHPIT